MSLGDILLWSWGVLWLYACVTVPLRLCRRERDE